MAGHEGLELRYVVTKYPFESRAGFSADLANFWPQRPFAFELPRLGHVARPGSAGIKDDPLKFGENFPLDSPRVERRRSGRVVFV